MSETLKISARGVNVFYGAKQAINDVSIDIATEHVTAFIGPSGCGKSTFLRALNRMNDTIPGCRVTGEISLDGQDIYASGMDVVELRARVGMVFQKPNPFPKSIFENVAYGPRIHGLAADKAELDAIVEKSLRRAGLWDEVVVPLLAANSGLRAVTIFEELQDSCGPERVPDPYVGHWNGVCAAGAPDMAPTKKCSSRRSIRRAGWGCRTSPWLTIWTSAWAG